jgi:hypothetical protein
VVEGWNALRITQRLYHALVANVFPKWTVRWVHGKIGESALRHAIKHAFEKSKLTQVVEGWNALRITQRLYHALVGNVFPKWIV